ncbi:hypothetical protein GX50_07939 [[Emmonsia] crescens]|uniref:Uncharacterized protein n=1 Tax=[Emmonsia] crescens TaxID=73230 RepID=A0A2B7Z7G4_9EURO|nr:hypothetical protein GX50_07939 [Emmonsia crescens]
MEVIALALKEPDTSNNKNVSEDIFRLKTVENGFFHLGDDKVLRSYDGSGNVVDYALPEDSHLKAFANLFSKRTQEHLYRVWGEVDSSKISKKHIFNPPEHLLPLHLSNLPAESGICEKKMDSGLEKRTPTCVDITCLGHGTCRQYNCAWCMIFDRMAEGYCLLYPPNHIFWEPGDL